MVVLKTDRDEMTNTLLNIVQKDMKKRELVNHEPSDVPIRVLLLAKISDNTEESIENVKETFDEKILSHSRINGSRETGRAFYYTESPRLICALIESSTGHVRNFLSRLEEFVGEGAMFSLSKILSVQKILNLDGHFRDYQSKVVTNKSSQEQEHQQQEQEVEEVRFAGENEQCNEEEERGDGDDRSESPSTENFNDDDDEGGKQDERVTRATMIDTCVNLTRDLLKIKSKEEPPSVYDFESLLRSEFSGAPTIEEYLNMFANERLILTRDDDRLFPIPL